jgi:hypothetical protein
MIHFNRGRVKQSYKHNDSISTVEVSEILSEMRRLADLEPFRSKGSQGEVERKKFRSRITASLILLRKSAIYQDETREFCVTDIEPS